MSFFPDEGMSELRWSLMEYEMQLSPVLRGWSKIWKGMEWARILEGGGGKIAGRAPHLFCQWNGGGDTPPWNRAWYCWVVVYGFTGWDSVSIFTFVWRKFQIYISFLLNQWCMLIDRSIVISANIWWTESGIIPSCNLCARAKVPDHRELKIEQNPSLVKLVEGF